jgi:integrase/recombinase XerC
LQSQVAIPFFAIYHAPMNDWIDLKEAAILTAKSVPRLRALCETGELNPSRQVPVKEGGVKLKWQLHRAAIENYEKAKTADYDALIAQWKTEMANGYHTGERLEPGTIKKNVSGVNSLWKHLERSPSLQDFTIETIKRGMAAVPAEKKGAPHGIYWGTKSFYSLLVREGLRPASDLYLFDGFKPKKNKNPKRTHLKSHEEFLKLLEQNEILSHGRTAYDRLLTGALIKIMYNTGMRVGEVCQLTLEYVHLDESIFYIDRTKTKVPRQVGIRPGLLDDLKGYLQKRPKTSLPYLLVQEDGGKLTSHAAWRRVKSLGERAGIPITPHGFRHTFATEMLLSGVPAVKVQKIGGWSKLSTLQIYDRSSDEDALDVLRGPRPTVGNPSPTPSPFPNSPGPSIVSY